ncbi:site-specific integrase [Holdemanella sp.]|uniref:site-specific integrase n=1 Tax=Holdemanella sp. TaxID=1971762 RepID=UPI002E778D75|nr:site-specific integrase [Holdemanella sp.]MEE0467038.1 site-specific integrase [Holdemanella sp.]
MKRKDTKGRVLKNGEYQEENGRYVFKYYVDGKRYVIRSWKLVKSDKVPDGKRDGLCLRDMEKNIQFKLNECVKFEGANLTVSELVEKYDQQKLGIRKNTMVGHTTVRRYLEKDPFGKKKIETVRIIDAKQFMIQLKEEGKSYSTLCSYRGVIRPAFRMAVDDELISRNPFDFPISDIMMNNAVKRDALTNDEQKRFLKFVKENSHFSKFYEGFYILIHTGMRISEFCGLTYKDVDFKRMTITISKQLQYHGANNYWIEKCKTNSGLRTIPIPKNDIELMRCFKTLCSQARMRKNQPEVDGIKGFLYLSEAGKPLVAFQWAKKFEYAILHHNRIYKKELPKITPHICRHTYCSNMIKAGVNPKVVQYLMGHSSSEIIGRFKRFKSKCLNLSITKRLKIETVKLQCTV